VKRALILFEDAVAATALAAMVVLPVLEIALRRAAGVGIFTMGQYLAPTERHHPVRRYYAPEEFADLGRQALHLGFQHVESAPLVRSSYMAHRALESKTHAASDIRGSGESG